MTDKNVKKENIINKLFVAKKEQGKYDWEKM